MMAIQTTKSTLMAIQATHSTLGTVHDTTTPCINSKKDRQLKQKKVPTLPTPKSSTLECFHQSGYRVRVKVRFRRRVMGKFEVQQGSRTRGYKGRKNRQEKSFTTTQKE